MRAFRALLRKEAIAFITNRTFVVIVGLPVIIAILFNLAFSTERALATVAIVRPPDNATWARVQQDLGAFQTLHIRADDDDIGTALDAAQRGKVAAVIDLRGLRLDGGRLAGRIAISVDELRPVSAEIVRSTVAAWTANLAGSSNVTVLLNVVRGVSPRQATIPLWLVLITLVVAISTLPLSIVEERELATLRALLVAPVRRELLLGAKALVGFAMILAMCALTLVLNRTPVTSPLALAVSLVAGAIAFIPIGLTIGAFASNQASVSPFAALLFVGLLLPVALAQTETPAIMEFARWLPSTALSTSVRAAIVSEVSILDLLPQLLYLMGLGCLSAIAARFAINREAVVLS